MKDRGPTPPEGRLFSAFFQTLLVALRMLLGDPAKCFGLILGVAFCTLLVCQQMSIFFGLLTRASNLVMEVREANIWVMDPAVETIRMPYPMRNMVLPRVRGVEGVAWAVPLMKSAVTARNSEGHLEGGTLLGIDDTSLVGVPDSFVIGTIEDLTTPHSVAITPAGYRLLFPDQELAVGHELELNDHRARITAIVDAAPAYGAPLVLYTRYSEAMRISSSGRKRLSFVLVKSADGTDPETVAARITERTGQKALTSSQFQKASIDYVIAKTGIPTSFGTVVFLGALIGAAVVSLTFNQFISDNIKQYAVLKAIGVRNLRLLWMTLCQAGFVCVIGYGLGLFAAALFFNILPKSANGLRGFYLLPEVAIGVAVLSILIVLLATCLGMFRVLRVDPATVFRG